MILLNTSIHVSFKNLDHFLDIRLMEKFTSEWKLSLSKRNLHSSSKARLLKLQINKHCWRAIKGLLDFLDVMNTNTCTSIYINQSFWTTDSLTSDRGTHKWWQSLTKHNQSKGVRQSLYPHQLHHDDRTKGHKRRCIKWKKLSSHVLSTMIF